MLQTLPSELVIEILSNLSVKSLFQLRLVSRQWHGFISANEALLYRHASHFHNFIANSDLSLDVVMQDHLGDMWNGMENWKDFCEYSAIYFQPCRTGRWSYEWLSSVPASASASALVGTLLFYVLTTSQAEGTTSFPRIGVV